MKKSIVLLMSILFIFCTANSVLADWSQDYSFDPPIEIRTDLVGPYEVYVLPFTLPDPATVDYTQVDDFGFYLEGSTEGYSDPIETYIRFEDDGDPANDSEWILVDSQTPGFPLSTDIADATIFDGENDFDLAWGCHFSLDYVEASFTYPSVPEPATMFLLGSGLVVLAGFGRKKFYR